ncbi:MAG: sulfotransferase [Acidobacteria bacterium]|nr:sulfotransferase [Acidobacteriota bacterium]
MSTGNSLIFLISQPRAGSTLLQRILSGHPSIHTLSEPWIALNPLFARRRHGASASYSHSLACEATQDFLGSLPGGEQTYIESVRLYLNHLYSAALAASGKSLFLDKTPRYYFIVDELRRVFPDARFVFLLRNPLAVLGSILETWTQKPGFGEPFALRADLIHDLLTAPDCLIRALNSPGSNDAVVHYENLTHSPSVTIARLCRRLHLDFHPAMIEYGAGGRNKERWAFGDQGTVYAEQRPVTVRAERWRQVLTSSPQWTALARAYLRALGPGVFGQLGYNYESFRAILGIRDEVRDCPDFLETVFPTPSYNDTGDLPSQLTWFRELIARNARVRNQPVLLAAGD